jgi:hypothetical protein
VIAFHLSSEISSLPLLSSPTVLPSGRVSPYLFIYLFSFSFSFFFSLLWQLIPIVAAIGVLTNRQSFGLLQKSFLLWPFSWSVGQEVIGLSQF